MIQEIYFCITSSGLMAKCVIFREEDEITSMYFTREHPSYTDIDEINKFVYSKVTGEANESEAKEVGGIANTTIQ